MELLAICAVAASTIFISNRIIRLEDIVKATNRELREVSKNVNRSMNLNIWNHDN